MPIVLSGSYQKYYNQGNSPLSQSFFTVGNVKFAQATVLDLAKGNFSRASSGSAYLGSTSSIGWSYNNQRRFEDRGDGLRLFVEGSRFNYVRTSRDITGAGWSAGSSLSQSLDGPSPDGASLADRMTVTSGGFGRYQSSAVVGSPRLGSNVVVSMFARRPAGAGTGSIRIAIQDGGGGTGAYPILTASEVWGRFDTQRIVGFPTSLYYVPAEGRTPNMSIDYWTDLHQLENDATFPSSPIVTAAVSASREADILAFHAGDVPDRFRSGPISFDILPSFSSTDITASISGSTQTRFTILSFGDNDFIALSGSQMYITGSTGFVSGALTSSALTWNRHQKLSITVNPNFGNVAIQTSPSSSIANYNIGRWSWPNTGMYIGAMSGSGDYPFFGSISNFKTVNPVNYFDLTLGNFSRTTSGSYYNGSLSSLAWANPNEIRLEDRGDGNGRMVLLEGSRVNSIAFSEDFSVANWTKTSTGISGTITAPDGTSTFWLTSSVANGYARQTVPAATWANNLTGAVSTFMRFPDGASGNDVQNNFYHIDKAGVQNYYPITGSNNWARFSTIQTGASGASGQLWGVGKDPGYTNGNTWSVWGYQVEVGAYFPSSYIRTPGAGGVTRAADVLIFANGTYPPSLLTTGGRITYIPDYSSDELLAEFVSEHRLIGINSSTNQLRLVESGGTARIQLLESGISRVFSTAITWDRGAVLTIEWRPNAGQIIISGLTSGNGTYTGTAFSWPAGIMAIGNSPSGAASTYCFGRFSRLVEVL